MDEFEHFVKAQDRIYDRVCRELADGRKRSHWMWFIFPQLRGLGHSAMAERYALDSLEQARRYLAHNVCGPRLRECTTLAVGADAPSAQVLFGAPDWLKFRSSMTLFAAADPADDLFARALDRYYDGERDERTIHLLQQQ